MELNGINVYNLPNNRVVITHDGFSEECKNYCEAWLCYGSLLNYIVGKIQVR